MKTTHRIGTKCKGKEVPRWESKEQCSFCEPVTPEEAEMDLKHWVISELVAEAILPTHSDLTVLRGVEMVHYLLWQKGCFTRNSTRGSMYYKSS